MDMVVFNKEKSTVLRTGFSSGPVFHRRSSIYI